MTTTIITTVPASQIKVGDMLNGTHVESKRILDVNVEIVTRDGGTRRIRKGVDVEVVRTVPTWADQLAKAETSLNDAVHEVRRIVGNAEVNATTQRWASYLTENLSATNLLSRLSWDTLTMATELHVEKRLQVLGHRIADADDAVAAIRSFVVELRDDLIDWTPGRSTSPSSNLIADAERDALRELVKGRMFATVEFAADYLDRLRKLAPADLDQPFDRDAFQIMDDAS